jgi:hypothetical protein
MNDSDSANTDAIVAYWLDRFDAIVGCSQTFVPQSGEGHLVSPPAYLSTTGSTPNFDAVNHTAFTPAPITSTGTFIKQNYTYQVSEERLIVDIDLPCFAAECPRSMHHAYVISATLFIRL